MKTLLQWLGTAIAIVVLGVLGLTLFGFYLSMTLPEKEPYNSERPPFEYETYRACPKWAQTEKYMNDGYCPGYPPHDRWFKEQHQRCVNYHSVDGDYSECGGKD